MRCRDGREDYTEEVKGQPQDGGGHGYVESFDYLRDTDGVTCSTESPVRESGREHGVEVQRGK